MFSHPRHRTSDQEGFTLIELLVVILIIGILAAIALPNFLGQTQKAQDASAKSDVRNAVSQIESCFTDAQTYTGCNNAYLGTTGIKTGTTAGLINVSNLGDNKYTITAYSRSTTNFVLAYDTGTTTYTCTQSGKGGCNASWTGAGN